MSDRAMKRLGIGLRSLGVSSFMKARSFDHDRTKRRGSRQPHIISGHQWLWWAAWTREELEPAVSVSIGASRVLYLKRVPIAFGCSYW